MQQAAQLYGTEPAKLLKTGWLEAILLPGYQGWTPELLGVWRKGAELDLGDILRRAKDRLALCPLELLPCVVLSPKARRLVAASLGLPRASEAPHDLCLAEVYCSLPEDCRRRWKGERSGTKKGMRPDATMGRTALELLGVSYSLFKVENLIQHCEGFFVELKFF